VAVMGARSSREVESSLAGRGVVPAGGRLWRNSQDWTKL